MEQREIEEIMDAHGAHLLRIAFFYLRDREGAKDIVQDVFISFYMSNQYEDRGTLRAYLTKLTVNRCKDHLRSWPFRNLRFTGIDAEQAESHTDTVIQQEEQRAIANAVLQLPVKYREVIVFHYYAEMKTREIAAFLTISENTVKGRLVKARKLLKDKLPSGPWEVLSDE